jgi:DUF4097 and DUF4098 domain-containing protein YvlB
VSVPPPPLPSQQVASPVRPGSGWERRSSRQQRRAAALVARQQRELQRAQIRASLRTSILGPFLLVSFGLTFLLLETGKIGSSEALTWFARWWPLFLVIAGFVLLIEWAFDSFLAAQTNSVAPARRLGFGTTILLLLVMLAGAGLMAAGNRADLIPNHWNAELADSLGLEQVFAQHRDIQQDFSAPLAKGGLLTIKNYRGNIHVTGSSDDGSVHVHVHQRLTAWGNDELRSRTERDRPEFLQGETGLLLRANGEGRDRTDLLVEVPHETAVQILPERGELQVTELRGPLTVSDHIGNVTLSALAGDVHLNSSDADASISAHSVTGLFSLEGRSGDISLSDVSGSVALRGDFFGTTRLERVHGPVHFRSSYTDFACAGIPGNLNIEGRTELDVQGVDGPVTLTTTNRNVTFGSVRGGLYVQNKHGDVFLTLNDPLGPVDVTNRGGSVQVNVPEQAGFQLSAQTENGEITTNLGLPQERDGNRVSVQSRVHAGGPVFKIRSSDGNIRINRGAEEADPPRTATEESD